MKVRDARWWFAAFLVITFPSERRRTGRTEGFPEADSGLHSHFRRVDSVLHCGRRKNLSKVWFRGFPGLYGRLAAY